MRISRSKNNLLDKIMVDHLKQAKRLLRKEMAAKLGKIPEDEIRRQTEEVTNKVNLPFKSLNSYYLDLPKSDISII